MKGEEKLLLLHPRFRPLARSIIEKIELNNITVLVVSTWRSPEEQEELKKKGKSKAGAWESWHNYGLAIDLAPIINGQVTWDDIGTFKKMGAIVMSNFPNVIWGGNWKSFPDYGHFEWHPMIDLKTAQYYAQRGYIYIPPTGGPT